MRITVLSEAEAIEGLTPEHGLSYLVAVDGQQFLFDTGASDVFLRNASNMGIDLQSVPTVVLSHGHCDHGDGLGFLREKTLVCHPGCFVKRYRKRGSGNLGMALSKEELAERFSLKLSRKPYQLTEHLIYLGEIPRRNEFEARDTPYRLEDGEEDFILDDSGLVYRGENGLVVVSGCAHAGICNMVDYAIEITGTRQLEAVLGGFHLKDMDARTAKTIEYLRERKVKHVLPSHCTRQPALGGFHSAFGMQQVVTGKEYSFD